MRVKPKIDSDKIEYLTHYDENGSWSVLFRYDKIAINDLFFKKDIPDDDVVFDLVIMLDYSPATESISDVAEISAMTGAHGDISYDCTLTNMQKLYFKEELISKGLLD